MKIKKDWWLANSVLFFISGVFFGPYSFFVNNQLANLNVRLMGLFLTSGLSILIAVALLKRSKLIFWFVFILTIFSSLSYVSKISKGIVEMYSLSSLIVIIELAFIIMLWQQVKIEGRKK